MLPAQIGKFTKTSSERKVPGDFSEMWTTCEKLGLGKKRANPKAGSCKLYFGIHLLKPNLLQSGMADFDGFQWVQTKCVVLLDQVILHS